MTDKQGEPLTLSTNQLVIITGARGTGKTTLAATYLPPSQIGKVVYIDNENSANNFRRNLFALGKDFGYYVSTMERFANMPTDNDLLDRIAKGDAPWVGKNEQSMFVDFFLYLMEEIKKIARDKYKVLVVDTGERLEAGMAAFVEANKRRFGVTDTSYGKLWTNGVYPLYTHLLQGVWDRGIDTVILTFHLKNVWENKRPVPGKVTHAGKKLLYYLSSLMIWLVNDSRNPNGEPAGLVLKERLGHVGIKGDAWDIKTMLPPRVPICTWANINDYLEKGYDVAHPQPEEMVSSDEHNMISELLNDTQIRLMLEDAAIEREENAIQMAQAGLLPTMETESVEISDNGDSDLPHSKPDAIIKWMTMGRLVPELLAKLREKEIGDDQIADRWGEVTNE